MWLRLFCADGIYLVSVSMLKASFFLQCHNVVEQMLNIALACKECCYFLLKRKSDFYMQFSILILFNIIPLTEVVVFSITFNKKVHFKCSQSLDHEKNRVWVD